MNEVMNLKEFLGDMSKGEEKIFILELQQSECLPEHDNEADLMAKMRVEYPECNDEVIAWILSNVFGM